ncbi:metal-dependent hydrolase [uncultured Nevskia sp.]|uniref:metal-dependent hydrolase n=1 Tax=uncultured Nevskia sp. TaxID=228950 RepID=UPI0025CE60BC|nr:metal-dependent hydrolase [uncultured Nevskia sp.]
MLPVRRNLHFNLNSSSVSDWHEQGPYLTQFINAMSIFFPEGERYFIHTVRQYADRVTDPDLRKAVTAFIGQEAMHGREHDEYNRLLTEAGLPAEQVEAHVAAFLNLLKEKLPPAAQLSVTIAQEHFTAILSELVLTDPRLIAGADRRLSSLWRWHALEETEHKAVAFDVYESVVGRGVRAYMLRTTSMVLTTAGFLGLVLFYQQRLLKADDQRRRTDRQSRGLGRFVNFMFRSPALLPRLAMPWLSYFRPGFHPWDHDNRYLLEQMSDLVAEAEGYRREAA